MDIKEIALRVAEESGAVGYSPAPLRAVRGYSFTYEQLQNFAEALIESYKAEFLKEVVEPVAVTNHAQLGYVTDGMHPDIPLAMWAKETTYSGANIALYTSDQVAAVILKVTKPLEDQLAKVEQRVAEYNELIYAVQTKHHDETRHQTALRYIRNAENRQSYTAANGVSS